MIIANNNIESERGMVNQVECTRENGYNLERERISKTKTEQE